MDAIERRIALLYGVLDREYAEYKTMKFWYEWSLRNPHPLFPYTEEENKQRRMVCGGILTAIQSIRKELMTLLMIKGRAF